MFHTPPPAPPRTGGGRSSHAAVELTAGNMTAGNLTAGDLTAGDLTAGDLTAGDLTAGGLTAGDLTPQTACSHVPRDVASLPTACSSATTPRAAQHCPGATNNSFLLARSSPIIAKKKYESDIRYGSLDRGSRGSRREAELGVIRVSQSDLDMSEGGGARGSRRGAELGVIRVSQSNLDMSERGGATVVVPSTTPPPPPSPTTASEGRQRSIARRDLDDIKHVISNMTMSTSPQSAREHLLLQSAAAGGGGAEDTMHQDSLLDASVEVAMFRRQKEQLKELGLGGRYPSTARVLGEERNPSAYLGLLQEGGRATPLAPVVAYDNRSHAERVPATHTQEPGTGGSGYRGASLSPRLPQVVVTDESEKAAGSDLTHESQLDDTVRLEPCSSSGTLNSSLAVRQLQQSPSTSSDSSQADLQPQQVLRPPRGQLDETQGGSWQVKVGHGRSR